MSYRVANLRPCTTPPPWAPGRRPTGRCTATSPPVAAQGWLSAAGCSPWPSLAVLGVAQRNTLAEEPVTFVVLTVLVVFLGGLGAAAVAGVLRAGRSSIAVGPDGITSNRLSPASWPWSHLESVAVQVTLRRGLLVTSPGPKTLRTDAKIVILIQPRGRSADDAFRIRVLAPTFTSGENIPIVRDLDAAFRAYGGPRYAGVSETLTHTL